MSFAASPNKARDLARAQALASLPTDNSSLALMAITKGMGAGPLRKALGDETVRAKINDPVAETEHGDTMLTLAVRHGSTESVRLLLQEGASINQVNTSDGASPLAVAIQLGQNAPNMVRVLLEMKADPSQMTADGRTPLLMAVPQGSAEVVRLLLGACTDKARASMADHATPQSGVAALHKAAFLGHDETVRHLLKAGAKAEITDAEGVTPLLLACRNGHASVVRALLKASSSAVGQGNNQGATPLHFAAKLGSAECCKMLLDSNATVNARAANDVTPLHLAAQAGKLKVAKLLLEAHADVNAVDKDGAPPLFYADVKGHAETFPDELISAPGLYLKPKPDAIALSYLNGASCNSGAKRLGIWDSTWNQREPSLERDTTYSKGICDPVKVRFPPILQPLGKREMQMV